MKNKAKETTKKIAELARIHIPENQIDLYTKKFEAVLNYVELLNELNTENIEPMSHAMSATCFLREDQVIDSKIATEINKNAPDLDGNFYQVPRVIEEA